MSPSHESPPHDPQQFAECEFNNEEREILLRVAHRSIEAALDGREISLEPPLAHLAEPRAAFTTLYLRGELHGCVGYVFPSIPLYRAIAETARAAAFQDTRFPPITPAEALELKISLSVLSRLQPIRPEEIVIGRHGLLITDRSHRGLLLPQVAVEHGWDRVTFLEQTCRKAGLSGDAWQQAATVEGFTAEIFGDSAEK